jgi:hypothetical protein
LLRTDMFTRERIPLSCQLLKVFMVGCNVKNVTTHVVSLKRFSLKA